VFVEATSIAAKRLQTDTRVGGITASRLVKVSCWWFASVAHSVELSSYRNAFQLAEFGNPVGRTAGQRHPRAWWSLDKSNDLPDLL